MVTAQDRVDEAEEDTRTGVKKAGVGIGSMKKEVVVEDQKEGSVRMIVHTIGMIPTGGMMEEVIGKS